MSLGNEPGALPAWRPEGELTLAVVREAFDHWRITDTDNGLLLALRGGPVVNAGPQSLIVPCVFASSLEDLTDKLSLQEWFRRMTADELDLVWRHGSGALTDPLIPVTDPGQVQR